MKKRINEINGLLLSSKQMKDVKGGTRAPEACGTNCPVNSIYICAVNAMGTCVCGGKTAEDGFSVKKCS